MKKYFVTSDLHSYYDEFIGVLDKAGFDISNPDHILIVCGDLFDRGPKTKELLEFIKGIPQDRRVLIRGNHEELFEVLLHKSFPEKHDFSNGTVRTFCALADADIDKLDKSYWYKQEIVDNVPKGTYSFRPYEYWREIKEKVYNFKIVEWFNSKEWVNYFEVYNYIFVHCFIPTPTPYDLYSPTRSKPIYREDWRNSTQTEWRDSTWGCPWRLYLEGLFKPEEKKGKTLVCGHWPVNDFHLYLEKHGSLDNYDIYIGKHLIGLDACTSNTGQINLLVINNEKDVEIYNYKST